MKGENGRKLIEQDLIKKNFKISIIECYKKTLKDLDGDLEGKKWRSYGVNALVVTSGEILKQLNNIISDIDRYEWLFKCKIFVVGKRLEKIAKYLGWTDIITSNYANNKYLLKVINVKKY